MRLLALALAVGILTACSGEGAEPAGVRSSGTTAPAPEDDTAAHTPTDLRHPCDAVPAGAAGEVLGGPVTAREVTNELAPRTLACRYVLDTKERDGPSAEIRSVPDPTSLGSLVRLYIGVDRLRHHPVDVAGADEAVAILQPDDDLVTVFAKQGFVRHAVVLGLHDVARGERLALRLARLVVRANL